jgi:DNA-binding transcriptional LysR family regulator
LADDRNLLRHLDLKHLRQLMKIADMGSIRAAAESLAITQPALSRSVRAMEEDLGVKLVERGPRGAELTAAGHMLLKYGRIIDANLSLAEKELGGLRHNGGVLERISIGMSWLAELLLARPLFEFALRMDPRVRLATTVGDYEALAPKLISGKLEFLVGPPPIESTVVGVSTTVLAQFPAVVLVRAEHPLARESTLSFADLVAQQWILPAAGTVPRITYDNFFLGHGAAPPEPLFEVQPLSPIIRQLMLEWDLVTILPRVVAEADLAAGRLMILPFEQEIVFPMHLTRRQMGYHSPVAERVVEEVARLCTHSGP